MSMCISRSAVKHNIVIWLAQNGNKKGPHQKNTEPEKADPIAQLSIKIKSLFGGQNYKILT